MTGPRLPDKVAETLVCLLGDTAKDKAISIHARCYHHNRTIKDVLSNK